MAIIGTAESFDLASGIGFVRHQGKCVRIVIDRIRVCDDLARRSFREAVSNGTLEGIEFEIDPAQSESALWWTPLT